MNPINERKPGGGGYSDRAYGRCPSSGLLFLGFGLDDFDGSEQLFISSLDESWCRFGAFG